MPRRRLQRHEREDDRKCGVCGGLREIVSKYKSGPRMMIVETRCVSCGARGMREKVVKDE